MSASAYSLSAAIPTGGFEITRGEPVQGGLRDPQLRHFFCPSCMSWLFTRPPEAVTRFLPEFVNVRATMLDDVSWFSPFAETWVSTKLWWVTTPAVRSYAEFPPVEDYARLLAEFSQALLAG
jgi:hypothetical protein